MTSARHAQVEPGWKLGLRQLQALLWRNWQLKKRSWNTTAVELLSPIILVGLLVFAYSLVSPVHIDQHIWLIQDVIQQNNGSFVWPEGFPNGSATSPYALPPPAPDGSPFNINTTGANITEAQLQALRECLAAQNATFNGTDGGNSGALVDAVLPKVLAGLQAFIHTKGPIPIPTLDEYILLSYALRYQIDQRNGSLDQLRGVRRQFGWNILGNLLEKGQIAFAPNTPDVLRLAEHLSTTHELFASRFYGVLETEEAGEELSLVADPPLWALVVFDSGPNASHADYTIRMNFTTVPRTWVNINKHRHWIQTSYKTARTADSERTHFCNNYHNHPPPII
ncbi:hypothetical protein WJX73_000749 [Symbiochloris irregularis]|uniref:ABC transporter permease n=1 Tax=Symbiochloris irregularis TaxID=706552 RepID=A0AAW1PK06_9CHLO